MVAKSGTYKDGELWLRCWHCGDSRKHSTKAHLSVRTDGVYHCLRCRASGRLSLKELIPLLLHSGIEALEALPGRREEWEDVYARVMPGPGTSRYSALDRFHLRGTRRPTDVFLSRDVSGEVSGLALIQPSTKRRRFIGRRLLGYSEATLVSSMAAPIRLVEGPYDVLGARDVCAYGIPSTRLLRRLRGHCVVLCPDGDVWIKPELGKHIIQLAEREDCVIGVEVLPDGKDPDEVPINERRLISKEEIHDSAHRRRTSRRRQVYAYTATT